MVMRGDIAHKASIFGVIAFAILAVAAVPAWSQGGAVAPPATEAGAAPAEPAEPAAGPPVEAVPPPPFPAPVAPPPLPVARNAAEDLFAPAPTPPTPPAEEALRRALDAGSSPDAARIEMLERRFDALEKRIDLLLRELVAARPDAPRATSAAPGAPSLPGAEVPGLAPATGFAGASEPRSVATTRRAPGGGALSTRRSTGGPAVAVAGTGGPTLITQIFYKLPPPVAVSMADFLRKHVIDPKGSRDVQHVAVDGPVLIVIATQKGHERIGQFLTLLPGGPPEEEVPGGAPTPPPSTEAPAAPPTSAAPAAGGFGGAR